MNIELNKKLTNLLEKKDTKKSFIYPLLEDAFSSKDLFSLENLYISYTLKIG